MARPRSPNGSKGELALQRAWSMAMALFLREETEPGEAEPARRSGEELSEHGLPGPWVSSS